MPADGAATTDELEDEFEAQSRSASRNAGTPELRLGAWEGPLDLLLELARARRVDLACLSIADLVEQCGAALEAAVAGRKVPLTRLSDWLVMAAHIALLRSRLLLPPDSAAGEEAWQEAEVLRRRLGDRGHAQRLAEWLERRPQLGRDVFVCGAAAGPDNGSRAGLAVDTAALFRACLAVLERDTGHGTYRPEPLLLWRVPDALARLRRLLPAMPDGAALERFLPGMAEDGPDRPDAILRRRAALASTLLAGLEMGREGSAVMEQEEAFSHTRIMPTQLPAPGPNRMTDTGFLSQGDRLSSL